MTAGARLVAALAICALGLVFGWASGGTGGLSALASGPRAWTPTAIAAPSDIDSYVQRIAVSGLFPDAELRRAGESGAPPETAAELARALTEPTLSAFVRRGDVWRIHIHGDNTQSRIYAEDDQLSDGWTIGRIEPTLVILRRDGESRRLEAFNSREPDDET